MNSDLPLDIRPGDGGASFDQLSRFPREKITDDGEFIVLPEFIEDIENFVQARSTPTCGKNESIWVDLLADPEKFDKKVKYETHDFCGREIVVPFKNNSMGTSTHTGLMFVQSEKDEIPILVATKLDMNNKLVISRISLVPTSIIGDGKIPTITLSKSEFDSQRIRMSLVEDDSRLYELYDQYNRGKRSNSADSHVVWAQSYELMHLGKRTDLSDIKREEIFKQMIDDNKELMFQDSQLYFEFCEYAVATGQIDKLKELLDDSNFDEMENINFVEELANQTLSLVYKLKELDKEYCLVLIYKALEHDITHDNLTKVSKFIDEAFSDQSNLKEIISERLAEFDTTKTEAKFLPYKEIA